MRPRDTQYCLALKPQHYKACHRFMEAEHYTASDDRLQFPTVVAIRDEKIVGMLSTAVQGERIVATNLVLAKELARPLITGMRLLENYETVLRQAGVVTYFFGLDGKDTELQKHLEAIGVHPYCVTDERSWYKRDLV